MTTTSIANWGPLVVATDVDEAILAQLKTWLDTYVKQVAAERTYPLALAKTYSNVLSVDEFEDYQLPGVYVTTAKTIKTVGGANTANILATWAVTVSCVVRGTSPQNTRKTAALYEGAVRRCFIQKCRGPVTVDGSFSDLALSEPSWNETEVAPVTGLSTRDGRYLAAGIGKYNVATDAAVQGFGGPDVPDADNYVPLATVSSVPTTDIQPKES